MDSLVNLTRGLTQNNDKRVQETRPELPKAGRLSMAGFTPGTTRTCKITCITGNLPFGGTDANVYIQLFGSKETTAKMHLSQSETHKDPFEQCQQDVFSMQVNDIGPLQKIIISHDDTGANAGWYLGSVVVLLDDEKYVFECNQWLDSSKGDKKVSREIFLQTDRKYLVSVTTGDKSGAGTDARVYIKMHGSKGSSDTIWLDTSASFGDPFELGQTDVFPISAPDVGDLLKLTIGHDDRSYLSAWFLGHVEIESDDKRYFFMSNQWFDSKKGDKKIERVYLAVAGNSEVSKVPRTLSGHVDQVRCVAVSEKRLLSGSRDGKLIVWELMTGKMLKTLTQHVSSVNTVAFSHKGNRFASGGDELSIYVFNTSSCELLGKIDILAPVRSILFSLDDDYILAGHKDRMVRSWHIETNMATLISTHNDSVNQIVLSLDGHKIASCSDDTTIILHDINRGTSKNDVLKGHSDWVSCIAFNNETTLLASGSDDRSVLIWQLSSLEVLARINGHSDTIRCVVFNYEGSRVLTGSADELIKIWDPYKGRQIGKALDFHIGSVNSMAFQIDGTRLVSGGSDMVLKVYDNILRSMNEFAIDTAAPKFGGMSKDELVKTSLSTCRYRILHGHKSSVNGVSINHDGTLVATCGNDMLIILWDMTTGKPLKTLEGHTDWISELQFSRDGLLLLSCGDDASLRVWDVKTGVQTQVIMHATWVKACVWSATNKEVATCQKNGLVYIWDLDTKEDIHRFSGHKGMVYCVAYDTFGTKIASGGEDKIIWVWDLLGEKPVGKELSGHSGVVLSVQFNRTSTHLVSGGSDSYIYIWDLSSSSKKPLQFCGHTGPVNCVQFFHRDTRLVSCGTDRGVMFWDVNTLQQHGSTLSEHADSVNSIAITRNGNFLVSVGSDKFGLLYDLRVGRALEASIEAHATSVLAVAYSHSGNLVVTCDKTEMQVWTTMTGERAGRVKTRPGLISTDFTTCAFHHDENFVLSGHEDGSVYLWDLRKGTSRILSIRHNKSVSGITCHPHGTEIATVSQDNPGYSLFVYNLSNDACRDVGTAATWHTDRINSVVYNRSGSYLATCSDDSTVKIWSMTQAKAKRRLSQAEEPSEIFQPDSCLHTLQQIDSVKTACFSRDGVHFATAGKCNKVYLYQVQSGRIVAVFEGHAKSVVTLCFNLYDTQIISGSLDGTIKMYNLGDGKNYKSPYSQKKTITRSLSSLQGTNDDLPSENPPRLFRSGSIAIRRKTSAKSFDDDDVTIHQDEFCANAASVTVPGKVTCIASHSNTLAIACSDGSVYFLPLNVLAFFSVIDPSSVEGQHAITERLPALDAASFLGCLCLKLNTKNRELHKRSLHFLTCCEPHHFFLAAITYAKIVHSTKSAHNVMLFLNKILTFFSELNRPSYTDWHYSDEFFVKSQSTTEALRFLLVHDYPHEVKYFLENIVLVKCANLKVEKNVIPIKLPFLTFPAESFFESTPVALQNPKKDVLVMPVEHFVIPLAFSHGNDTKFMSSLVETGQAEYFQNVVIRSILQQKWDSYGFSCFLRMFGWYLMGLVSLVFLTILRSYDTDSEEGVSLTDRFRQGGVHYILECIAVVGILVSWLYTFQHEVRQGADLLNYVQSFWNFLDASNLLLGMAVVLTFFFRIYYLNVLLEWAVFLRWFGVMYYLRAFESTGTLIRIIFQTCIDTRWFLVIFFIIIISASNAFYIMLKNVDYHGDRNGFTDPWQAFLTVFNMLIIGGMGLAPETFEQVESLGSTVVGLELLFVITVMFVTVILLNTLIAIMTNSYIKVSTNASMELTMLRAEIILEQEMFMTDEQRAEPSFFPWFTHVLMPSADNKVVDPHSKDSAGIRFIIHKLELLEKRFDENDAKVEKLHSEIANKAFEAVLLLVDEQFREYDIPAGDLSMMTPF